jgi:hypothetical protein
MMDYSELVLLVKKNTKEYMNATLKRDWDKASKSASELVENSVRLRLATPQH